MPSHSPKVTGALNSEQYLRGIFSSMTWTWRDIWFQQMDQWVIFPAYWWLFWGPTPSGELEWPACSPNSASCDFFFLLNPVFVRRTIKNLKTWNVWGKIANITSTLKVFNKRQESAFSVNEQWKTSPYLLCVYNKTLGILLHYQNKQKKIGFITWILLHFGFIFVNQIVKV